MTDQHTSEFAASTAQEDMLPDAQEGPVRGDDEDNERGVNDRVDSNDFDSNDFGSDDGDSDDGGSEDSYGVDDNTYVETPVARDATPDPTQEFVQVQRPERLATGDAAVEASLDDLDAADGRTLQDQIDAATETHRTLQSRLSDLND
ncbi:hypothetical protein [Luteipulveratus mongoliensis]|uniref:Uncharacterized protein n=1 Tax=Luteipulveratus mongoliensis TaxID=571913 RepID=A0A0K1JJC2_9MICO|nr:hypothetical protein [Luteipulveratus mongoliensis]AKU16685.1 hypothetical protein VV02_13775 [Luteipulveratus mongoliensis]